MPTSSESLTFRPRARLLQLMGDQLIGSSRLAVFELVKNAYDAGTDKHLKAIEQKFGEMKEVMTHAGMAGLNLGILFHEIDRGVNPCARRAWTAHEYRRARARAHRRDAAP